MTATRTERLTLPARQLRRADRIVNLTAGRTVTAFDVEIGDDTVDVYPTQANLDAGADRRYTVAAGELLVVDREVEVDGTPVRPAVVAATPVEIVAEVTVRGRRYTARREAAGRDQRTEVGQRVAIIVRNSRGADVGTVFVPSGPAYRRASAIVVGCPTSWSGEDSRHVAREILAQLDG